MANERDLNIDREPIGSTADDDGGSGEMSAVDGCEVLRPVRRGINTLPGPDDALGEVDDRVKGAPKAPREVRVRRDRQ